MATKDGGIVRTNTFAGGGITKEEQGRMEEHSKLWIKRAFRTDAIDNDKITAAIRGIYAAAKLEQPRIVIVPSPLVMAVAGGFAAGIWYLRQHGDDAATHAATRAATYAATRAATDAATYAATYAATDAATDAATYAATRAATDAATDAAWIIELAKNFSKTHWRFLVNCAAMWWRMYQGGNMWAAWDCYLTAYRDILGLKLPSHESYAHWEQAAIHGGFRIVHEKFCMVSDFPTRICVDEQGRPHSADGPSHRWRDGWSLYYVHGVQVDQQIIERPDTLTVKQINAEQNAEVRRVMMERFGFARYLQESGAKKIHEDELGELYRTEVPDDEPLVMVKVLNSTEEFDGSRKPYFLRVDPECRPLRPQCSNKCPGDLTCGHPRVGKSQAITARNAVASTFGMTGEQYTTRLLQES